MVSQSTVEALLSEIKTLAEKQSELTNKATELAVLLLPRWLPTNEAAEALERPSRSLTNLVCRGHLKYGTHWRRGVRGRSYEFEISAMSEYFNIPPELKRSHLQPRKGRNSNG